MPRKLDQLSVRIGPEIRVAIDRLRADQPFEYGGDSEAARFLIEKGIGNAQADGSFTAKTAAASLKERRLTAAVEAAERENAIGTDEVIYKTDVVEVLEKMCRPIRQAIQQVTNAADGLTVEQRVQLDKWKEDTLTNLSTIPARK